MPDINELVTKVQGGVAELQAKAEKQGKDSADVKAMAEKVTTDLVAINQKMATQEADAAEYKKRVEHLESIGLRDTAKLSADEMKHVALAGLQQVMRENLGGTVQTEIKAHGEKIELKSFVGADYTATDPSRGGVFVTPQMINEIIMQGMREINPILTEITLTTHATSADVKMLKKTGEGVGTWAGEMQNAPKSDKPKWSSLDIPMHRVVGEGACTMEVLSGTTVDFRNTIMQDMLIELSNAYIDAFTAGSGDSKPQGWTRGAYDLVETENSGVAKYNDLILIQNGIQERYRNGSKFYLTREVLSKFLIEKDTTGAYLQMFGLNGIGGVPSLAGVPFAIIPTLATVPVAGDIALYYGNLRQAYRAVQWGGSFMKRDELTHFSHGVFEYAMARFAGGRVINTEALVGLTIKA
jgi:HK97 family phage major capsid protein